MSDFLVKPTRRVVIKLLHFLDKSWINLNLFNNLNT
jgi:hypothetical protein